SGDAPDTPGVPYTDISELMYPVLEREYGYTFEGTGWKTVHRDGNEVTQRLMAPDFIISLPSE
ncbi:MAG: hypothetical protein ABH877_05420, partial [bacterium]